MSRGFTLLAMKARAPLVNAQRMSSYDDDDDSTTTLISGWSSRSNSRQLRPSSPRMPRSSATISGRRRSTRGRACAPVWVAPTISMSSTDSNARRKPSSIRWLSSAISRRTVRYLRVTQRVSRRPGLDARSAPTVGQPSRGGNRPHVQIAFRRMNADRATELPRVLVAEPDAPTRTGLRLVLAGGGLAMAGEAADAETAVALAAAERPDLVLVAAELPGGWVSTIRRIAAQVSRARLIVLTAHPSGDQLVDAVLAGAVGYLSRDTRPERLPAILHAVLAGEVALPRRHSRRLVEALRGREARRTMVAERSGAALTDREWEILELLAANRSTGEISERLGLSAVTARRHISSLVAKLGVPDRASAVELIRLRSGE